jgi:hypothetical protein
MRMKLLLLSVFVSFFSGSAIASEPVKKFGMDELIAGGCHNPYPPWVDLKILKPSRSEVEDEISKCIAITHKQEERLRAKLANEPEIMSGHRSTNGLELKILRVLSPARIVMTTTNVSTSPIKVWDYGNSWGFTRLRVLRIRNGQLETFYKNPHPGFHANVPETDVLQPGEYIEWNLDLNEGGWCWREQCSYLRDRGIGGKRIEFRPDDTIIVIYDVPPPGDEADTWARKSGAWSGSIADKYDGEIVKSNP